MHKMQGVPDPSCIFTTRLIICHMSWGFLSVIKVHDAAGDLCKLLLVKKNFVVFDTKCVNGS